MSTADLYCYIIQKELLFKMFCIKYRCLKKIPKYLKLMTFKSCSEHETLWDPVSLQDSMKNMTVKTAVRYGLNDNLAAPTMLEIYCPKSLISFTSRDYLSTMI